MLPRRPEETSRSPCSSGIRWCHGPRIHLIGVGIAQLLSQVFIVLACHYASSVKLGPFVYAVIVFTALIDWVIWDQPPTLFVCMGMALVIGGGLVAISGKTDVSPAVVAS